MKLNRRISALEAASKVKTDHRATGKTVLDVLRAKHGGNPPADVEAAKQRLVKLIEDKQQ